MIRKIKTYAWYHLTWIRDRHIPWKYVGIMDKLRDILL